MDKQQTLNNYYSLLREKFPPHRALILASIATKFEERAWLREDVRLRVEPEKEDFFSVFGYPPAYTDHNGPRQDAVTERHLIETSIKTFGVNRVVSEFFDGEEWIEADEWRWVIAPNILNFKHHPEIINLMATALEVVEECDRANKELFSRLSREDKSCQDEEAEQAGSDDNLMSK